jgi:G6PDH family F420-dependent oxidoreductase
MIELGYSLSSEEFGPRELVRLAQRAEEVGFEFASVSDHYQPWTDRQGHSPFVWSVIGGIAQVTQRLRLGTGVTCPIIRIHPAIVAHAAATAAVMMPKRFFLGVGAGENLNEHILGHHWPPVDVRHEMLAEAIAVMRVLWQGGSQSHRGVYYTVEDARIYTLPDQPPALLVAAGGVRSAELAGQLGDGLIATQPNRKLIHRFVRAGGADKPRYGHLTVCWGHTEAQARRTAREYWPNAGIPRALHTELPLPRHFEQAAHTVSEDAVAEHVICGPAPTRYVSAIEEFEAAGFTHVSIHQIGPDQEGFFRFCQHEILPHFQRSPRNAQVAALRG